MANEKRLIYANEALRMIKDSREDNPFLNIRGQGEIWRGAHDNAIDCVNTCSTVDAVEVVRCKDCRSGSRNTPDGFHWPDGFVWCTRCKIMMNSCDFCSYGERRTGNENP